MKFFVGIVFAVCGADLLNLSVYQWVGLVFLCIAYDLIFRDVDDAAGGQQP